MLDHVVFNNLLRLFIKLPFGKREKRERKKIWRGDVDVVVAMDVDEDVVVAVTAVVAVAVAVALSEPKNQERKENRG